MPLEGGDPVLVIDKPTGMPTVSTDSKLLAYGVIDPEASPAQAIAVAPAEGGPPFKRFCFLPIFNWMPDGRALAYLDEQLVNLWALPLDGGPPRQLTDFKSDLTLWFAFSRDGKQLALARGTVTSDVVLITDFK